VPESRPRLVYIVGWGRSGSTLLGNILGSLPGAVHTGEIRRFWNYWDRRDRYCGCGETIADCPFWGAVRDEVLADPRLPTTDLSELQRVQRQATRTRNTLMVARAGSADELHSELYATEIEALRCLYRAVARVSQAEVMIDSSKQVPYGALAGMALDTQPTYIHLVRDPRATAYSWQRVRTSGPGDDRVMPRYSAFASSVSWVVSNLGADQLRRRRSRVARVGYEDLVESPGSVIGDIAEVLGRSRADVPLEADSTVSLQTNHAFAGNPSRFHRGRIRLRNDDQWVASQRRVDRLVCDLVTFPFLRRFGYSLLVR
jgi:sulfotransferase family protein